MNNREVAHLWAHQAQRSASGSNFFFDGPTIYSYGHHFPIARLYKGVVLFTTHGYSATTAKHKSYTLGACSHMTVFKGDDPTRNPCSEDVKRYKGRIQASELRIGRARNVDEALRVHQSLVEEANSFCETFGFKTRFSMPSSLDAIKERAKVLAERERKATIAKRIRIEKENAETIARWLAGESVQISYLVDSAYLRASDGQMETSKGARVPLEDAHKAYRFVMAMRSNGWRRNGEQFPVGSYQLDAVNEFGVIAGCHRIAWREIERFAATQGW